MTIGRIVAWALLLAALIVLCRDLIGWFDTGHYAPIGLGVLWADLATHGHDAAGDLASHHDTGTWHRLLGALIAPPAFVVFGLAGLILLYLCRRRGPGAGRSRRRRFRR